MLAPTPAPQSHGLDDAQRLLKSIFGYDCFRPMQAEIVERILERRDTMAVMPTGSGKSLCYQLPALLFDGLTVVVSPLIALMQDQVMQLRESGIPAAFLNSTLEYREYVATMEQVRRGEIKLLYTAPETLVRNETLVMLDRSRVACLAIDEAHCISAWGHDFRPEYRQLLPVRARYENAVCVAFTATATPRVRDDIRTILGFQDQDEFLASFNRENLFLEVQPRMNGLDQTLAFLAAHRDQSGIIYCNTRRQVEQLTGQLQAQGWLVAPYHAGMDSKTRAHNQARFSRDQVPIIVATIAFGMGINKSNVRFVLHYNLPESLESYYQEIGRAGRDGLRADCLLLFSRSDLQTIYGFIEEGAASEQPGRHARLAAMVRYAEAETCRRKVLLEYFGEAPAWDDCGFCDICLAAKGEVAKVDATIPAQKFLSCVMRTGEIYGATHIIRVLRGSKAKEIVQRRHDALPTYGIGAEYSEQQWRHYAEQFIRQGLLMQDMEHGSLYLTAKGRDALKGAPVYVTAETRQPIALPAAATYDASLFEKLRVLRRTLADQADVPAFVIFSDRTLTELSTHFPQSLESLRAIHGIGEHKLAQYGDAFLEVIRSFCAEHGLSERPSAPLTPGFGASKPRWAEAGELFDAGHSVAEIQGLFGVKQDTVVRYLSDWLRAGHPVDAERVHALSTLSGEDQARVLGLFAELGAERLRPIFDALQGTILYEGLNVMRTYYLAMEMNDSVA